MVIRSPTHERHKSSMWALCNTHLHTGDKVPNSCRREGVPTLAGDRVHDAPLPEDGCPYEKEEDPCPTQRTKCMRCGR